MHTIHKVYKYNIKLYYCNTCHDVCSSRDGFRSDGDDITAREDVARRRATIESSPKSGRKVN